MKKTLLALAAAGVLGSTGAIAANEAETAGILTTVQYRDHDGARYRDHDYRADARFREWYDHSQTPYNREVWIRNWLERGINDGRIDHVEARRLERELARLEAKERAFNRDRRITPREEAELHRDLDRLADNLRRHMQG